MDNFKQAHGCEVIVCRPGQSGLGEQNYSYKNQEKAVIYGHQAFESQLKLSKYLGISTPALYRWIERGHYKGIKLTRVKETK